jgi:hypothetical protein
MHARNKEKNYLFVAFLDMSKATVGYSYSQLWRKKSLQCCKKDIVLHYFSGNLKNMQHAEMKFRNI